MAKLREKLRGRGIIVAIATLGGLMGENAVEAAPAIVLKELGKMALAGATTAAGTGVGSAAAASGAGANAVAGAVMTGVKAKIITAVAVTAVSVGGVATYKHVTRPVEIKQPLEQYNTQQFSQTPSRRRPVVKQSQPTVRKARTAEEVDWSEWEEMMMDMILAEEADRLEWEMMMEMMMTEDTTATHPADSPVTGASRSKESKIIYPTAATDGMSLGFGGGYGGGDGGPYDHGYYRDILPEEMQDPNNANYGSPGNRP